MTKKQRLSGKTALITGASRGIGAEITKTLSAQGAFVVAVARSQSSLEKLKNAISGDCEIWALDACSDELVLRMSSLKKLDILINNVGTNVPKAIDAITDDELDHMIDLNIRANFRISRSASSIMTDGASIVTITSQMGHVGSPNRTAYCMCKHALEGLTKALAVELAPRKIRVNSVAPTFIETDLTKPMLQKEEFRAFVNRMIPLGTLGSTTDVAQAVLYLCSQEARMITGHSLVVDGGWTAQ